MNFIVGKIGTHANKVGLFKKGIDEEETFIFNNQGDATDCALNMTKRLGGEWIVFEIRPITTTKIVTMIHEEE